MATETVYTLGADQISVSGGQSLSGFNQGSGVHLIGQTITLNSNSWTAVQIEDNNTDFSDSQGANQSLTNNISYNGTTYDAGENVEAEYSVVVEDPSGNTYTLVGFNINAADGEASYGTIEGLAFVGGVGGFPPIGVPLTVISNTEGPSVAYANLATPPCFVRGSLVETPDGARLIEELEVGDWVLTLDHGPQQVRVLAQTRFPRAALVMQPELRPVEIKAGAFGAGCPERDTMVSPQHGVLVSGVQAALWFGEDEILVPAKKLCNDQTIRVVDGADGVEYFHLVFDRHEILTVDGMQSESFRVGSQTEQILQDTGALRVLLVGRDVQIAAARPYVNDRATAVLNAA